MREQLPEPTPATPGFKDGSVLSHPPDAELHVDTETPVGYDEFGQYLNALSWQNGEPNPNIDETTRAVRDEVLRAVSNDIRSSRMQPELVHEPMDQIASTAPHK